MRHIGLQRENGLMRRQEKFVSAAMREVSHFASRLALIFFKAQGQLAISCAPLGITFRGGDFGCRARRYRSQSRSSLPGALPCASKGSNHQETANKAGH